MFPPVGARTFYFKEKRCGWRDDITPLARLLTVLATLRTIAVSICGVLCGMMEEFDHEQEQPVEEITLAPEGSEWVILHTRPRAEKKAVQAFEFAGATLYLPLRRKDHRYGARLRTFWSPLFPGYVFGCFESREVHKLKSNQYVANVLTVVDQAGLVHQLNQIQQALAAGELVDVMPYLEKGKPVRVTGGPFKGVEGIIERLDKKTRVVISIEMIQQSVFMEVDSAYIEMIN